MNLQIKLSCSVITLPCNMNHFRNWNTDLNKEWKLIKQAEQRVASDTQRTAQVYTQSAICTQQQGRGSAVLRTMETLHSKLFQVLTSSIVWFYSHLNLGSCFSPDLIIFFNTFLLHLDISNSLTLKIHTCHWLSPMLGCSREVQFRWNKVLILEDGGLLL